MGRRNIKITSFGPAWLALTYLLLLTGASGIFGGTNYVLSNAKPPMPQREFRGVWVATMKNIDWPSRPGLSTAQQKAEMIALLDRAVLLRLNAIIFQVRPACDALYASRIEPWSEFLTGQMGEAPQPYYDPLAFAIEEAHRRGLELHAWFNPYRARQGVVPSPVSKNHVTKTHPNLVKTYAKSQWLDPGEPEVQEYSLRVVMDVVERYDIDGVHFDDYFYPYEEKDGNGRPLPFPDWSSWKRYKEGGGQLSKEDWRRENVNTFVRRVSVGIKARKPWVRYGISPFGIWRPGYPPQIRGFDAYDKLFADSRRWLGEGWVDYLAPQLYWAVSTPEQSFPVLLKWWTEQNTRHRHLWAGLSHRHSAVEIVNQIFLARKQTGASGHLHWSMKALLQNRGGVDDLLLKETYTEPALVPASPWLGGTPPSAPRLSVSEEGRERLRVQWTPMEGERVWLWWVQTRVAGIWKSEIVAGAQTSRLLDARSAPEIVAVTAIDRVGNASQPAVLQKVEAPKSR